MTKTGCVISKPLAFVKQSLYVAVMNSDGNVVGFGNIESYKKYGNDETYCWVITKDVRPGGVDMQKLEVNGQFPLSLLRQFYVQGDGESETLILKFNQWKSSFLNKEVDTGKIVNYSIDQKVTNKRSNTADGNLGYYEFARILPNKRDYIDHFVEMHEKLESMAYEYRNQDIRVTLENEVKFFDRMIKVMRDMKGFEFQPEDVLPASIKEIW